MKLSVDSLFANIDFQNAFYETFTNEEQGWNNTFLLEKVGSDEVTFRVKRRRRKTIFDYCIFDSNIKTGIWHKMNITINNILLECEVHLNDDRNDFVGEGKIIELDNNKIGFSIDILTSESN